MSIQHCFNLTVCQAFKSMMMTWSRNGKSPMSMCQEMVIFPLRNDEKRVQNLVRGVLHWPALSCLEGMASGLFPKSELDSFTMLSHCQWMFVVLVGRRYTTSTLYLLPCFGGYMLPSPVARKKQFRVAAEGLCHFFHSSEPRSCWWLPFLAHGFCKHTL